MYLFFSSDRNIRWNMLLRTILLCLSRACIVHESRWQCDAYVQCPKSISSEAHNEKYIVSGQLTDWQRQQCNHWTSIECLRSFAVKVTWMTTSDYNYDVAFVALSTLNQRRIQVVVGSQGNGFNQPRLSHIYSAQALVYCTQCLLYFWGRNSDFLMFSLTSSIINSFERVI